jgi:hypothetical protein
MQRGFLSVKRRREQTLEGHAATQPSQINALVFGDLIESLLQRLSERTGSFVSRVVGH